MVVIYDWLIAMQLLISTGGELNAFNFSSLIYYQATWYVCSVHACNIHTRTQLGMTLNRVWYDWFYPHLVAIVIIQVSVISTRELCQMSSKVYICLCFHIITIAYVFEGNSILWIIRTPKTWSIQMEFIMVVNMPKCVNIWQILKLKKVVAGKLGLWQKYHGRNIMIII